jgi:hypothetical protein
MSSEPYKLDLRVQQAPKRVQPDYTSPESQSKSETLDPNSPTNLDMRMKVLQAQAIADSIYDLAVPPPTENFANYRQIPALSIVAAALMIGLHMYLRPNCWPKLLFK